MSDCTLVVVVDRNLSVDRHDIPTTKIVGHIANVEIILSHFQYDLIIAILSENLGNELHQVTLNDPDFVQRTVPGKSDRGPSCTPSDVMDAPTPTMPASPITVVSSPVSSPSRTPTSREPVLGQQLEDLVSAAVLQVPQLESGSVHALSQWVGLEFILHLENVSLHISQDQLSSPPPLARLDLINSTLSYTSHTNGSDSQDCSTISIFSREIIAHDTRPLLPGEKNLFTQVLSPLSTPVTCTPSTCTPALESPPQLQVTYRSSSAARRVSIILNRARVILAIDWMHMVKDWFLTLSPNLLGKKLTPSQLANANSRAEPDQPRKLDMTFSVTEPEIIILEDCAKRDSKVYLSLLM